MTNFMSTQKLSIMILEHTSKTILLHHSMEKIAFMITLNGGDDFWSPFTNGNPLGCYLIVDNTLS